MGQRLLKSLGSEPGFLGRAVNAAVLNAAGLVPV